MTANLREPKPRVTSHRGVVTARGFFISGEHVSRAELERRAVRLWESGGELFSVGDGVVTIAPRAFRVAVHESPGAPLVERDGVLSTAPLSARDRERLERGTDLVLVQGGAARGFRRADLPRLDPADLFSVAQFEVRASRPLTDFAAPPDKLTPVRSSQELYELRAGRSDEQREQIGEIVRASEELRLGSGARGSRGVLGALFERLSSLFRRRSDARAVPSADGQGASSALVPAPATPRASVWQRLGASFARLIGRTRLMRLFTRQQAKYLSELLDHLSRHDDMEVLRRAIPLGGEARGSSSPALGVPSLRDAFDISLAPRRSGGGYHLIGEFYTSLRRSYEQVFERLDRAGKHEEAAFFLAEILNEAERAVSYLEKHGRLKLAAELAEARKLAPGLVVRQWFLAGDVKRAVAIAVREGAFDDAIQRLTKSGQHEAAAALRLTQAERLASAGSLVAAARLVRDQVHARALALRWLALAREAGEPAGLALELELEPQRFDLVHSALRELFVEEGPLAVARRAALAEDFTRLAPAAGRPLGRELAREMLADAGRLGEARLSSAAKALAGYVGDALRADWPVVVTFDGGGGNSASYRYGATDTGSRPLLDVVAVGSRFALALGEAGVLLVDRHGRRVAHFEQPADELVVAPDTLRLLTVARRGDALRVGRIDLASRRCDYFGDVKANAHARTFDGQTWVVAESDPIAAKAELLLLDLLDDRPSVLRRVPLPVAAADKLQLGVRFCHVLGGDPFGPLERLRYELPSFTLRERSNVELTTSTEKQGVFAGAVALQGEEPPVVWERWLTLESGRYSKPGLRRGPSEVELPSDLPLEGSSSLQVFGARFGVTLVHERGGRVLLGSLLRPHVGLDVTLDGATSVALRLDSELAFVADSAGRLLSFDLKMNRIVSDLRI